MLRSALGANRTGISPYGRDDSAIWDDNAIGLKGSFDPICKQLYVLAVTFSLQFRNGDKAQ